MSLGNWASPLSPLRCTYIKGTGKLNIHRIVAGIILTKVHDRIEEDSSSPLWLRLKERGEEWGIEKQRIMSCTSLRNSDLSLSTSKQTPVLLSIQCHCHIAVTYKVLWHFLRIRFYLLPVFYSIPYRLYMYIEVILYIPK
jgi:hypothetical protein